MKSISLILKSTTAIAVLFAVCMALAGCDKDKKSANISVDNSKSLAQEVFADEEHGNSGVSFTTTGAWTSSISTGSTPVKSAQLKATEDSPLWVSISPDRGDKAGSYTIAITLEPNTTGIDRTAAITISCNGTDIVINITQKGVKKDGTFPEAPQPQELAASITTNTTLKDLGLPIDYCVAASVTVKNNAILTIEPGVTIQFARVSGSMRIEDGAMIKAIGTAEKHIQFVGATASKGSWGYFHIETKTDNEFRYVDFLNGGGDVSRGALYVRHARVGLSYCKISGSKGIGFKVFQDNEVYAFDHNVIENCDDVPVTLDNFMQAEQFDLTSDLTNNANPYVPIANVGLTKNSTIKATTVPYYLTGLNNPTKTLTISEGVTFYMSGGAYFSLSHTSLDGVMLVNGTPEKPVIFTRLPGSAAYWNGIEIFRSSQHVFNNCIIEYAGETRTNANLKVGDNGSAGVTLNNVVLRHSKAYGIVVTDGFTVVNHNNVTFENNATANVLWNGNALNELP